MAGRLTYDPIRVEDLTGIVSSEEAGAVAVFLGVVRNHAAGKQGERKEVTHLEYQAYPEMALAQMDKIERQAMQRWRLEALQVTHRLGRLSVGEASVAIAVSSAHRAEAMEACRFVIEELKKSVPIWKKEFFRDGSVWVDSGQG
ncbi:MAG: molybdenum cofactor biosynthesis protein MoaE [Deltaproteobacteria bacterium]|nr:molybdenum cofactor biosynthesis protein MoaE [Deltaproteobacteria bacterium]